MKNTVFISTYYNNPHFIELQKKIYNHFIDDDFDFVVINDAGKDTKSLISGELSEKEIKNECSNQKIRHVRVPQDVHATISNGGLVPDGFPVDHPTERHRACFHWILKNIKNLGFNEYKNMVIIESDIFPTKKINISNYMENYDIIGPGKINFSLTRKFSQDQYWPKEIDHLNEINIKFFCMYMFFVNLKTVRNIDEIDIGGFAGTDTGGKTFFFMENNPNYRYLILNIGNNRDYQVDLFSKGIASDDNSEFVHYRAGSNWDLQSIEYYQEKINRMIKRYIPLFNFGNKKLNKDLLSRDKEHVFYKEA
jgi:hypothetical protein